MPDFHIPGHALTRADYYRLQESAKPMVRRHSTEVSPGAGVWCLAPGRMVPVADHQQTDAKAVARKQRQDQRNAARPSRAKTAVMTNLRAKALAESKELRDGNDR
jgi:hypothetical protein